MAMGLKTTGLRRPCVVMRLLAIAGLSHVSVASGTFNEATAQAMPDANLSGYAHNLGEYVVSTHHRSAGNGSSEVLSLPQRQLTPEPCPLCATLIPVMYSENGNQKEFVTPIAWGGAVVNELKVSVRPKFEGDVIRSPDSNKYKNYKKWMIYEWDEESKTSKVLNPLQARADYADAIMKMGFYSTSEILEPRVVTVSYCTTPPVTVYDPEPVCTAADYVDIYQIKVALTNSNDPPDFIYGQKVHIYVVNTPELQFAKSLSIKDDDSVNFNGADVTVETNYEEGADSLGMSTTAVPVTPGRGWVANLDGPGWTSSGADGEMALQATWEPNWNGNYGRLQFTGEGSTARYEEAFRAVVFSSTSLDPRMPTRVIGFAITDDMGAKTLPCFSELPDADDCSAKMAIRTVFKVVGFNLTASVASSTEAGAAAIVIVRLLSKPSSPLLVTASSSNAAEAVSNPNFLILSETNWDIGEAIQFEGQSDTEDDGDQAYLATCAVMVTQDPDYTKVFPTSITLTNEDDPRNKVYITAVPENNICVTSENGTKWDVYISLSYWYDGSIEPFESVIVTVVSNRISEGALYNIDAAGNKLGGPLATKDIVFLVDNWDTPKVLPVFGIDDFINDGNQGFNLTFSAEVKKKGIVRSQAISVQRVTNFISCVNTDDDEPGVDIVFLNTLDGVPCTATSEAGQSCDMGITLKAQPTHDVKIEFRVKKRDDSPTVEAAFPDSLPVYTRGTSLVTGVPFRNYPNPPCEVVGTDGVLTGAIGPCTWKVEITFSPGNWSDVVKLVLSGVDDAIADGDQDYKMMIDAPVSADPDFGVGFTSQEYLLKNEDNDISTLEVFDSQGDTLQSENMWTDETGVSTSFSLNIPAVGNPPVHDITVVVQADMPTEGALSTEQLVFTTSNFSQKQYVTITGQDDNVVDGTQLNRVSIVMHSADELFDGVAWNFYASNYDDDGLDLSMTTCSTSESDNKLDPTLGCEITFKPSAPFQDTFKSMHVTIIAEDATEGLTKSASGEGTLTFDFDESNWMVRQTFRVYGVDDFFADGAQTYMVKLNSTLTYQHEGLAEQTKELPITLLEVTNEDDESADVILSPGIVNITTECFTSDCASIAHISLAITSEPVVPLRIPIRSTNYEEGTSSVDEVVFDSTNWRTVIDFDILGVDDMYDDGDKQYIITIGPTITSEEVYQHFAFNLSYINIDDDQYGLTTTIIERQCSEWGNEAEFLITLDSMPIEPVLYSISSMDATEGIANPSLIVLAADNWQQGVTIVVAGQQDTEDDGLVEFGIQVAPMISRDELYLDMPMRKVFLECADQPANYVRVYVSKSNAPLVTTDLGLGEIVVESHDESWQLHTTEDGTEDEFFVSLNKWHGLDKDDEQPFEKIQVRVEIDSVSSLEAELLGGSTDISGTQYRSLVFDDTNWNIPQQIRIKGVDDDSVDGMKTVQVMLSADVKTIGSPTIRNVPSYKIHPASIDVLNEDLDTAHVSAALSALTPAPRTSENGDFVIIDVALSSRSLFPVTFSSTISDNDEGGIVEGQTFTITPELWDFVYNIKVVGQDDLGCAETMCPDGDIEYDLVVGPSVSEDPNYNGWTMTFVVTNTDNDIADV